MLKELVQFTNSVIDDPVFRNLNLTPKEGLHLVLSVEKLPEQAPNIADIPVFAGYFNKKKSVDDWLGRCAAWAQAAWMANTNKCFDLPTKAFHSCSPFCFALKKASLESMTDPAEWHSRISAYFAKAFALLEHEEDKKIAEAFRIALNDRSRLDNWLAKAEDYKAVKEGEYLVFYLDLPLETYAAANHKYLKENLFNTSNYNLPDPEKPDLLHGTSNWLNGFPTKKPFLMHQSATFDIAGRLSSEEARVLYDFSDLSRRKLFPNPLPLFVMADERERAFKIFRDDAVSGGDTRKGYLEIIEELAGPDMRDEVGNYYLLFRNPLGEIWDFDFVSRFEFNLNPDGLAWEVRDLFGTKEAMSLTTVRDLMNIVLPPMFNNALVVRRKDKGWIYHWFDEMDPAYTKTHNAFLLAMKYRKSFYDFIYKSQRQSVTGRAIEEILLTGLLDDIRLDKFEGKYNSEGLNIRTKLNLLFSLHQYFSPQPNPRFMPENITQLRDYLERMAKGDAKIETDEQFAFAAGQVVARVFHESESADRSYKYLEPFLGQSRSEQFRMAIGNFIKRYKHVEFPPRFRNVSADVLTRHVEGDLQKLLPVFLAGVFSKTQLYWEKREKPDPTARMPCNPKPPPTPNSFTSKLKFITIMATPFQNRVFGCVIVKSINSNYNADFSHQPRTLPDGTVYATDKVLKYSVRNWLKKTSSSDKVFYFKSLSDEMQPRDLGETYINLFGDFPKNDGKDKDVKNRKEVLKNLLTCTDVRLFGGTFAEKGVSLSIHGTAQVTHGVNRFPENAIYSEQIASPFRNANEKSADSMQTTLGTQFKLREGHYVHHFSVNPHNLTDLVALSGGESLNDSDIEKLKAGLSRGVTLYDSSAKSGTENELLLWVQLKPDSKLVLPSFVELIEIKDDEKRTIDLTKVSEILARDHVKSAIEKIEIWYDKTSATVDGLPAGAIFHEIHQ